MLHGYNLIVKIMNYRNIFLKVKLTLVLGSSALFSFLESWSLVAASEDMGAGLPRGADLIKQQNILFGVTVLSIFRRLRAMFKRIKGFKSKVT